MNPRSTCHWLLFAALLFAPSAAYAQEEEEGDSGRETFMNSLSWIRGGQTGSMGPRAEIDIPAGYVFAGPQDTRRLMSALGNLVSNRELGVVAPESFLTEPAWFVVFEFDDIGYVENADEEELDADAILENQIETNDAANERKRAQGLDEIEVLGWEIQPRYDPVTKNLEWALRLRSNGEDFVNVDIRLLGRKGVMQATIVADLQGLSSTVAEVKRVLDGYRFKTGETYGEYRAGDKVWKYGLTGLIVGGGAALALKGGLFKWLWKILVVVGAAIAAFFKKIFGGGSRKTYRSRRRPPRGEAPPAA
jgi:uncharacterized membrane-anchored protein